MLLVLFFGLSRILKPLTNAARAMRLMADGAQELKVLPLARHDEVGDLVQGFNVLVERLKVEETARMGTRPATRSCAKSPVA
ncbi:MAG: HAMP domain-containing protein [Pseudomonadota bacterium]